MREALIEKLNGLIPKEIMQQIALPGKEIGTVHPLEPGRMNHRYGNILYCPCYKMHVYITWTV